MLVGTPYLHRQLVPLDMVNLDGLPKAGTEPNLFNLECEGMCGL
jgi:hypothetical protein